MYLLDANIFITSKNTHYGLDFVPAFWQWLDEGHLAGLLCSIDKIKTEIDARVDELTEWAGDRGPMFLSMDEESVPSLGLLSAWAMAPQSNFTQGAQADFLASADFQLVAYAHAHDYTVVTHEVSEPARRNRVKIPDACIALGVQCINPFTMLRNENAQFVLSQ